MSERWEPEYGDQYWFWNPHERMACQFPWLNDVDDAKLLDAGNVHPTKEAAEAWGAAQGEREESA